MLPEVRNAIREAADRLMINEGLTWHSIHIEDIKTTIDSPVSGRTLYRICKPESKHTTTVKNLKKILDFLKVSHTENYGIFQLMKIEAVHEE